MSADIVPIENAELANGRLLTIIGQHLDAKAKRLIRADIERHVARFEGQDDASKLWGNHWLEVRRIWLEMSQTVS